MMWRVGLDVLIAGTGDAGDSRAESFLGVDSIMARRSSVASDMPDIRPPVSVIPAAEVTGDALRETTAGAGDGMVETAGVEAGMLAVSICSFLL
jgi:hypothetical protein